MKPKNERYRIAVDFDGVLHSYDSPWVNAHTIPDPPVTGAIEWLHEVIQKMDVVIFSTRCKTWRGRRAMRAWLKLHAQGLWNEAPGFRGIEDVTLSYEKPPALVYLDDRAIRFEGNFPTVSDIHRARPWNKRVKTTPVCNTHELDDDMGVNCPTCGVRIRFGNAGGYRTYCDKCADAAAEENIRRCEEEEYLKRNDELRHVENQQCHCKP